jgi:hypothetical protein
MGEQTLPQQCVYVCAPLPHFAYLYGDKKQDRKCLCEKRKRSTFDIPLPHLFAWKQSSYSTIIPHVVGKDEISQKP